MDGDASNPQPDPNQPQISPHGRRRTAGRRRPHFPVNSSVEVQTNEEDFKGVYFSATVLAPPTSPKRSWRKKSRKLYVEYHNLLAHEDGSDRLREYVDVAFVRPVPPGQVIVKGFEPDDVVDAFYKDGWWTGVVNRALAGGERYVVTFHNPPDELEFGLAELRAHWDWVNGNWVRPQRQSIAGLMFDVGRKVEVSFDREDFQDAWFQATINEDLGNGTFLVDYNSASIDNYGPAKARVDSLHIRPCPPLLKDKNFVLLEKVDAFFDFGWWSGIITKELENSIYLVFFKQMKCDKEFSQSELRPHMDWKDGKWFTSSQEPSNPSLDDGVRQHHTPEHTSASMAIAPMINSLFGEDTFDEQTHYAVISTNEHFEQSIPDNQKLCCATASLTKRANLSDSGGALSQPLKKLREGANNKDGDDGSNKEFSCGLESPETLNIMKKSLAQTTLDQSSSNHPWEDNVQRKQRNSRTTQNATENVKSTSSSLGKGTAQILPLESLELDFGEKEPDSAGNTEEGVQNEHAIRETELPVVIGLPCAEDGSSGMSGGNRSRPSNKKVLISVDDQIQQVHNFTIRNIKDGKQSGIGEVSEKRKRGRPRKILGDCTETLATGNPEHGGHSSIDLNKKDDDSQRLDEVVVIGVEASIFDQEKTMLNQEKTVPNQEKTVPSQEKAVLSQEKLMPNQEKTTPNQEKAMMNQEKTTPNQEKTMLNQEKVTSNPKKAMPNPEKTMPNPEKAMPNQEKTTPNQEKVMPNQEKIANGQSGSGKRKVRMTKRILASKHEEAGVEESVRLGENRPSKRGRRMITNGRIAVKVRDFVGASGGKVMMVNRAVDVVEAIEPSNEFDNEPLSKWIEEMHMSSVIDGSRLLPVDTVAQRIGNGDDQGNRVVLDEASEKQPESGRQSSNLVDKGDTTQTEPQSLPSENNTAGGVLVVLDEGTQKQSESGTQTPPLVDKVPIEGSEPQSLPSVEEAAVVLFDQGSEKWPENEARATAMVDKSPLVPSQPQSSVEKTIGVVLNKDNEKRPENGMTLAPALVDKDAIVTNEPENLPFVKNTVLWKTIESMEIFQRLPQKPHFQPLENFKESSREGLAIGYMVTFSSLVERASKLQVNDPISIMEDIKETLADLEKHGFHVRPIQDSINQLLAMKEKEVKLVNDEHTLNSQITEHSHKKTRIESEIEEINGHIQRLQIKLAEAELSKEREDEEIAFLQVRLRETQDSIKTLKNGFKGKVSSIL